MTKDEYRTILSAIGLSIRGARTLGISERQSFRYASGKSEIPLKIENLLRSLKKETENRTSH